MRSPLRKVEEIADELAMRDGNLPPDEKDQQSWTEKHELASQLFLEAAERSAQVMSPPSRQTLRGAITVLSQKCRLLDSQVTADRRQIAARSCLLHVSGQ